MEEHTLRSAVRLARDSACPILVISGGEPSDHPELLGFCRIVSASGLRFSLCTNGMWLGDPTLEYRMERISRLAGFCGAQVYTNAKWYRFHVETLRRYALAKDRWESLGFQLDTTDIRAMLDIGRARDNPLARAEAEASPYHNSCLAACVTAVQSDSFPRFFELMLMQGRFCTPLIDYNGDFHMSESCLCPSVGNVATATAADLFAAMRRFRPCGGCVGCRKYLADPSPKMTAARRLLGQ